MSNQEHLDVHSQLLQAMNAKMDAANDKLDRLGSVAAQKGAVAGAVTGGVTGGLVATAICIIKAKFGL